jgi:phosphate transport system protein
MVRHFDAELKHLKDSILTMGGMVEKALESATQALIHRDAKLFEEVFELERKINRQHVAVDEECLTMLARQSPLAADLRLVLAVVKINTDLERMGDQAVNIAKNGQRYIAEAPIKPLIDLPKMAAAVQAMVRKALDAFVRTDTALAHQVLSSDDEVDNFKHLIFRELIKLMREQPKIIEQALTLILIARNLERLGDHATNIAEDVIFAVTGKDIRHQGGGPAWTPQTPQS